MSGGMTRGAGRSRFRDQDLQPFAVVRSGDPAPDANEPGQWVVIVDPSGAPIGAFTPGRPRSTSLIIARADAPVETALETAVFDEVDSDIGVVLVDDERIVGVWAGSSLERALLRRRTRGVSASQLPSDGSDIPLLVHGCGYVENSSMCGTPKRFQRKPSVMPPCPNNNQLSPHTFVW